MPSWVQSLKTLQKKIPDDWLAVYQEFIAEKNDRGAALIAAAQVENVLRRLLEVALVDLTPDEWSALFERDAPFSSFSKLIRVTYAFGLIDKEFRQSLDRIREIRNTFAHAASIVTFETEEIANACSLLSCVVESLGGVDLPASHPKVKYIGACFQVLGILALAGTEDERSKDWTAPLKWSYGASLDK